MTTIQKLILHGFKSFPKRTEIPLGNTFNMFLGPNGSGKSNLVDSLCFVLGKSSLSELRAKKSSNLIFHGNPKTSPANNAEVTLELDNSKNIFPIKENPLKITRIVKQSGQSTYKINNNTVTRQQVLDLLNHAKIDPDGYNIVLQGDIVKFTEMKPDERREIIENISGISVYEDKKNKCLLELEKVDSKLNEATIILTEREANLRELKKDRDQALKYKDLQKEIKDHKATHIHLQKKDKETKRESFNKVINDNQNIVDKINSSIEDNKKEISKLKEEIKSIITELEEKGEKEQLILRKEIESLKETIIKTESRIEVCKTELERISSRKDTLKDDFKEITGNINKNNKGKEEINILIKEEGQKERPLTEKIAKLKEKYNLDEFLNIDELDKNIDKFNNDVLDLQGKKQVTLREKDKIDFQLKEIKNKLEEFRNNKELQELKTKKDSLNKTTEDINKLTTENNSSLSQLSKARQEIVKLNNNIYDMQLKHNTALEDKFLDTAIKKILNLKIKGIHGTISQLGKVNSRYALALETAAGQRINSIIVENDEVAANCIKYLKENKLGRATFLPLNKIKPKLVSYAKKEGIEGLAIDLVEFNQRYKNAFSYIFGSTLVVKDIEIARRIGIGSLRMVTLDGDLVEQSGAMIGGFSQRKIAKFREIDIEKEMQEKENNITKLKSLIEHLERKKSRNEEEILSLKELKANVEFEIIKLEKTLGIKIDTTELTQKQKLFSSELNNIDKNLKETESDIEEKQKEIKKIKEQKLKLKEKLKDPTLTKEFELLEQEKSKIKEKIIELKGQLNNIDAQIKTIYLPEKEKIEKILKQQDIETEKFSTELNGLISLIKNRNIELKEKEKQEKQYYSNFKNLGLKRNKLNETLQKKEFNIIKEEEKIRTVEQRNNNLSIDRAKIIAEIEGLDKEFEQYSDGTIKKNLNLEELRDKIKDFEKILSSIGNVNLRALEIYETIEKEYKESLEKKDKLIEEKQDVINLMNEIEAKKKDIFIKCYNEINRNFINIFSQLTTKADATLSLENPENPLEAGLDIIVKLGGKKQMDIKSLSGGEKALTALAFIFAIQEHQPSSFYLLDEVDASLDKRNSEMLAKLIQKYSKKAQYIVISHNDDVVTEADQIYGVSMQDGISKVISLKF